jgi:hypothetical protein
MMGGEEKKKERERKRGQLNRKEKKRGRRKKKWKKEGGTAQHYVGSNANLVMCTCHHSKTKKKKLKNFITLVMCHQFKN